MKSERVCLICAAPVSEWHRPYRWLEQEFGNGLICGRGPCLIAALALTRCGSANVGRSVPDFAPKTEDAA